MFVSFLTRRLLSFFGFFEHWILDLYFRFILIFNLFCHLWIIRHRRQLNWYRMLAVWNIKTKILSFAWLFRQIYIFTHSFGRSLIYSLLWYCLKFEIAFVFGIFSFGRLKLAHMSSCSYFLIYFLNVGPNNIMIIWFLKDFHDPFIN